jgi:hypothetical protein
MKRIPFSIDEYDLRARLFPAVLVTLPAVVTLYVLLPATRGARGLLSGSVLESAILFWLIRIARDQGKRIQDQLYTKWGGKPTTAMLRHSDRRFDPFTKDRYKKMLTKISGLSFPNEDEEIEDPLRSDRLYESGVRALIEARRGKSYRLIFSENCNFGFMRNLLGLKPIGLCVAIISLTADALAIWKRPLMGPNLLWIPIAVCAVIILLMTCFVTQDAAKRSADAYADALLRSCEQGTARQRTTKVTD